ncbi:DUF3084 domain-containing protein [Fuchsiella alkaliacetigena]|uniref:DUF3084 domain-containing protein n=1 Tax=Fuchsiella alkaliacetigena TaxID=957042 RepID=UPI00200B15B4|nr:DUF3084 domain-containing protein [Fuchsiella alkaliacetigena]MCK8824286.1 DUF3084 domain-containing protein [Fuchsiella alkaliacetigena]
MYGAIMIISLIVISGLIAYIGDQIGMKVGRSRLSIFGLRPRHTSILVTILTGIMIATITISLLLVTSRGVRMALFNMEAMLRELNTLTEQVESKDDKLSEMQLSINTKSEELEQLQGKKAETTKQLTATQKEYQLTLEKLAETEEELARLNEVKEALTIKVDDLDQEVASLEKVVEKLTIQRDELEARLDNLSYSLQFVGQKYIDSLVGDIVYQKEEVIYADTIEAGLSDQETVESLDQFIVKANQKAVSRGIEEQDSERVIKMYEDDLLRAAQTLRQEEGQMVVRLVAQKNTLKEEELLAKFEIYQDYQVYQTDEVLAKLEIEKVESMQSLERELELFLTEINANAIEAGLIPDAQGKVGSVSFSQFYDLFDQIDKLDKPVEVKVVAEEDIWRSDSLVSNVEFQVRSLKR